MPSYKNNVDKDSVICVAVNDPYVLNDRAEKLQAKDSVSDSLNSLLPGIVWYTLVI